MSFAGFETPNDLVEAYQQAESAVFPVEPGSPKRKESPELYENPVPQHVATEFYRLNRLYVELQIHRQKLFQQEGEDLKNAA